MAISFQDSSGTTVRFDGDIVSIGRDSSCDFSMPHEQRLQPRHAILRKMAGRWLVETAGEWNVQVGSGPAGRKCWVKPNDVIHLTEAGPDLVFQTIVATDESKPAVEPVPTLGAHTATSMAAQWHYSKRGERHGPVNGEQLRQLAVSGQLQPTDLVWRDGLAEWQKASSVKGLFPPQTSGPTEPPPIPHSNREKPIDGSTSPVERLGQSQPSHLRENEIVVKQGRANLQRGIEAVGGQLYLTDRRLVFEAHKFNVQSAPLQIDLGSVVDVRKCWTRLLGIVPSVPNSIAVTTRDGTVHRFVVWGRESWISAIGRQTPAVSQRPPLRIAEPPPVPSANDDEPPPIPT